MHLMLLIEELSYSRSFKMEIILHFPLSSMIIPGTESFLNHQIFRLQWRIVIRWGSGLELMVYSLLSYLKQCFLSPENRFCKLLNKCVEENQAIPLFYPWLLSEVNINKRCHSHILYLCVFGSLALATPSLHSKVIKISISYNKICHI